MSQQDTELTDNEFACLIMRACGTRFVHFGARHAETCRFCLGILHVAE